MVGLGVMGRNLVLNMADHGHSISFSAWACREASTARYGPSIMPGGSREAYERVQPIFEASVAQVGNEPCVT
jgi:6-phosphogluconate dehydrogenase